MTEVRRGGKKRLDRLAAALLAKTKRENRLCEEFGDTSQRLNEAACGKLKQSQ
jgi:hypothetical protein